MTQSYERFGAMLVRISSLKRATTLGLTLVLVLGSGSFGWSQTPASGQDAQIQADVIKALDNKRFKDVKASVQGGVVNLSGTVGLYSDKEDADKKAHHRKNVKAVQNMIEVAGAEVGDVPLRLKRSSPSSSFSPGLQPYQPEVSAITSVVPLLL